MVGLDKKIFLLWKKKYKISVSNSLFEETLEYTYVAYWMENEQVNQPNITYLYKLLINKQFPKYCHGGYKWIIGSL